MNEKIEVTPPRSRGYLYRDIVNRIKDNLKRGVIPWEPPWQKRSVPINFLSKRPYNGINIISLWMRCSEKKFKNNQWITESQIKDMGAKINTNEEPTPIVFGTEIGGRIYWVFNIEQVSGLPEQKNKWKPIAKAEYIIDECGAEIKYKGEEAEYRSDTDQITLPAKWRFFHSRGYYSTIFHEITHWSGHKERLDRLPHYPDLFAKWFEEIVAEIGAAFLCAETGVRWFIGHPRYINHYLELLDYDWKSFFKATRLAQESANYTINEAIGRTGVEWDYKRKGRITDIKTSLNRALGQYSRYYNKLRIGITIDPDRRWAESEHESWRKMIILYETTSKKYALDSKRYLLSYLRHSPSWKVPISSPGAKLPDSSLYYVYALIW
jgi:antirestriction protein ArdC